MTYSKASWQNPYASLSTTHDIWQKFTVRMRTYGFDTYITYTFIITPVRTDEKTKPTQNNNAMEATGNNLSYFTGDAGQYKLLEKLVNNERLLARDPLAYHARKHGTVAIMGQDFLDPGSANYDDAKSFYEDMAALGVRNSMCIPLPSINPWTPHGFGLHTSLEGDSLLDAVDEHFSCIMFDCTSFSKFFDAAYRAEKAERLGLTKRQVEVINLICSGLSNTEIAATLNISEPTVSFHLNAVRDRLGIKTLREIHLAATRLGIVDIS